LCRWAWLASRPLEDRRNPLAAADALRRERVALAFALQKRGGLAGDAGAGGTERMAKRDGAAIEIGFRLVDAELAHAGERLRGEGFIDLDDVDVLDGEAGALQRLLRRRDRADAHDLGRASGDRHA